MTTVVANDSSGQVFAYPKEYSTIGLLEWKTSPRPFLRSLLEMLRFYAESFLSIATTMNSISTMLSSVNSASIIPSDDEICISIVSGAEGLRERLFEIDLGIAALCAGRIIDCINNKGTIGELRILFGELNRRISDELSTHFIFMIPANRERFYKPPKPIFGECIASLLPELDEDISEAGKCFALSRYTACVFHLMRIMELCVQKFGDKLGVSLAGEKTWQVILDSVRAELKRKYPSHSDPDRIIYEGIISHLESVKIAWRNPTMHPKNVYTEEQAKDIFESVRIFTNDLADML
jgi:hypothetical protein